MTVAEIVRAEIAKFLKTGDAAPAPAAQPAAKPVSDELREKRLKALEKARAAKKAKGKAKPAATPKPAPAAKTDPVPKRDTLDPVKGKRLIAEAYVSGKGTKSILLGNGAKQGRLVFHDREELVQWVNEVRAHLGADAVALADLHFGG